MTFKTSLVISTYNWPEALKLVFESIISQSRLPDEIIIADDGSSDVTRHLISDYVPKFKVPVIHIWHPDNGFQKTLIMNKALKAASGDYIIQIDGDILLHPQFISDHIKNAIQGYFIKGSRAMLNKNLTSQIIQKEDIDISLLNNGVGSKVNATYFPVLSPLFYGDSKRSNDLRGCNFSFWKKDFVEVNGYNNDLTGWGHEDIELAARLVNSGIKRRQLKLSAVCYHLFHKINARNKTDINFTVYKKVVSSKIRVCANGFYQSF